MQDEEESSPLLQSEENNPNVIVNSTASSNRSAITFSNAFKIPGVIEFSICLFFAKLVSYTFLFWLPFYIKASSECRFSWSSDPVADSVPFHVPLPLTQLTVRLPTLPSCRCRLTSAASSVA